MDYIVEPIFIRSDHCALKLSSKMRVSDGNPHLTLTATQWTMKIKMTINGQLTPFTVVENMLRSFIKGTKVAELGLDMYVQDEDGFEVRFAGKEAVQLRGQRRREIMVIDLHMEFAQIVMSPETAFEEMLVMADCGVTNVIDTYTRLAPAVFDKEKCNKLSQIIPLIRPLKLALHYSLDSSVVEQAVEREWLHKPNGLGKTKNHTKCKARPLVRDENSTCWQSLGQYFACIPFEHRLFIDLNQDGENLHEAVYMHNLTSH